ncbi:MAG: NADPH-dependent FMN reductase [Solirubrobacteraceae bacterium]
MAVRVLGICGSLRRGSYNRQLLDVADSMIAGRASVRLFDGLKALPPFDEDDEDALPAPVGELRVAIYRADALLVATPEYNASVPGQLKNAIDWASRPFSATVLRGKPAAVIGASTSLFGAVWAQAEVRKSLATAGAVVVDRELPVPNARDAFTEQGCLADPGLMGQLDELLDELLASAQGDGTQRRADAHRAAEMTILQRRREAC